MRTIMAATKHERITINPAVMVGKPCIKGTRITIEQILRELGAGLSLEDILDAHPHLTREDVFAAAAYAADVVASEDIIFSETSDAVSSR
jgi:uncharacterized protein (DUF433 family)